MTTFASLCSGAEMLGQGIESVLGPLDHVWYAENDKAASAVMAHHYPGVPNLGDITVADWAEVPRVDVMAAGFSCQDASFAGRRAGLRAGTRTGIWLHIVDAIDTLRPSLIFLENVDGLHSARADCNVERCPWCMGDEPDEPVLRASGRVVGDLSGLGYDARWVTVPASDTGAPHRRKRAFFVAYPADTESLGHWIAGAQGGQGIPSATAGGAVRTDGVALLPTPAARDYKGHGPADLNRNSPNLSAIEGLLPSVDLGVGTTLLSTPRSTDGTGSGTHGTGGPGLRTAISLLPTPNAGLGERWGSPSTDTAQHRRDNPNRTFGLEDAVALLPTPRATDGTKGGPNQRGSSGDLMLPSAVMLLPTPTVADSRGTRNTTAVRSDLKPTMNNDGWTLSDIAYAARWGEYAPAIARWESVLGRCAPDPTETGTKGQQRLSPRFVEWLMGLPAGWVYSVPGITRNDQLRILGNGVVPAQAAYAYRYLLSL
jgi:DNA (cytosine-5)-methyltransferase 1